MQNKIKNVLSKYVDDYSFVSVDEYVSTRKSLQKNDMYNQYGFLKGYQTIITVCLAYPSKELSYKKGYGLLSRYSYGIDYHIVMREKLNKIEQDFEKMGIHSFSSVDTGKIDERWASYVSGLGMYGKNQFIIHKTYGSYIYLATIVIDQKLEKSFKVLDTCGDCTLCIDSCPTNALDGRFHINRCISETTQSKRELTNEEIEQIRTLIYGCDICQKVCPKNKGIDYHIHPEFEPTGIEHVPLKKVLSMTNKEYIGIYKYNASSWKGPLIIKRNALCLLLNKKDTSSIPLIQQSSMKYHDVLWYNSVAKRVIEKLKEME